MKTKLFLAAMILAASGTIANAQVLGGDISGGVGGALGGSLGGGLGRTGNIGAAGHGAANGAFGADLDARSLRRTTSDTADRTKRHARSAANATSERTRSTVGSARAASKQAVATTAQATQATTDVASSTAAKTEIDRAAVETAHASAVDASASREGVSARGSAQGAPQWKSASDLILMERSRFGLRSFSARTRTSAPSRFPLHYADSARKRCPSRDTASP